MKVKLKSIKEIKAAGYELYDDQHPSVLKDHVVLVRKDMRALPIKIEWADRLEVAPSRSITEEAYELFRDAFEKI